MKTIATLFLASLGAGCVAVPTQPDPRYVAVAESALKFIERSSKVVAFVAPSTTNPSARAALSALRKVIAPSQVPQSSQFTMPEGYFEVGVFAVYNDYALFGGKLGPLWRATGPNDIMGCGVNFAFQFERRDGVWHPSPPHIEQC